jgi:hypothetical protein
MSANVDRQTDIKQYNGNATSKLTNNHVNVWNVDIVND